jgi:hypothetical protein
MGLFNRKADGPGADAAVTAPAQGFLGMAASEVDVELHPSFAAVGDAVTEVSRRYADGQVDAHRAATVLGELVVADVSGNQWTVGALSGRWFRRLGPSGAWQPALTPVGILPSASAPTQYDLTGLGTTPEAYLAPSETELAAAGPPEGPQPRQSDPADRLDAQWGDAPAPAREWHSQIDIDDERWTADERWDGPASGYGDLDQP